MIFFSRISSTILSFLFIFLCLGCSPRNEVGQLVKSENELKSILERVEINTSMSTSPTTYQVIDASRSKQIALITSDVRISKGDHLFVGDDIWDVYSVKISVEPTADSAKDPQHFRVAGVQLLVNFVGKSIDQANK